VAFRAWINSLFDSYTCFPVWHLEPGLIVCLIATEIAPSGCGVDSSRDRNRVDRVLVGFDSGQVVPE